VKRVYLWLYIHFKYGFHLRKPFYPFRIIGNFLRAKWYVLIKSNKFVLRGIDFAVTYNCNFRCEHCYAERLKKQNRQIMTIENYRSVCEQAMRLGCICFSLQGGEVFMRRDWQEIIRAFKPHRNHILLTTNGSLITEERVKKLKKLGLDTLYFSVDSGIAEEHDKFRNAPGNFDKIMKAVDYCRRHGIKVVFNTCITKQSLYSEGLIRLLEHCHKGGILIEAIFARCLGNFDRRYEVMLDEKDVDYYYALKKKYPLMVRDLDNNYGGWGCPAVKEVLYITAYGDVCPCPYSHISLGNVGKESLQKIRERGLRVHWYDHFHRKCLTAQDKDFIKAYYPLVENRPLISLDELMKSEMFTG